VVSQRLLPRKSGQGRVVAAEVMINTSTIRDLIAEGRIPEIRDYMADGSQYGMQTFDQHLTELVHSGEIDFETAKGAATNPADFELGFRMGRARKTPMAGLTIKPTTTPMRAAPPQAAVGARSVGTSPLGANPLGTGHELPPIGTTPSGQDTVKSPSPLSRDVFGSGFESLFGQ
jgi:twitching motility protein PilT